VAYAAHPKDAETALYYARALAARNSIVARARGVRVLRKALLSQPRSSDLRIALADLYYRQGYLTRARNELRKAVSSSTDPAPAYARLGRIAFRDWLKFQRPEALAVAAHYWQEAADRRPRDTEPWLGLGILALVAEDGAGAERSARNCLAAADSGKWGIPAGGRFTQGARGATPERATAAPDPRGEAWLMLGGAAYLEGKLGLADSAFTRALPLLSSAARACLLDITPAASDADTVVFRALAGDERAQGEFLRRFWQSRDPDLTTEWNELRLEVLARGTIAYFLYFDQRRQSWDERGALLVRYGIPEEVQYNPPLQSMAPMTTNRLVWSYPSLGMAVLLEDRYLNETYDLPVSLYADVDPAPDPEAEDAAVREGRLTSAGRGLFRPARRGLQPLGGEASVAVFRRVRGFDPTSASPPGADVARVEVYLATQGRTGESGVEAEAVVFDSTWHELARQKLVRPAWCYSDTLQVSQANFDLPRGEYTVGVSARDGSRQAAGTWRVTARAAELRPERLELSDLELACEYQSEPLGNSFDKSTFAVIPNPRRQLARDRALGVYFEIYGLQPGDAGRSQLSVEYTVESLRPDRRPFFVKWIDPRRDEPRVQVVREDEGPGRARYQFVSADLAQPPPGPYRLQVRVTDKLSGQSVAKSLEFTVVP
jgi:GWxTD domain-containing protein